MSEVGSLLEEYRDAVHAKWGLRKTGGTWKVVHEHTSAPVEMATGKVELKR